ncbi:MAG: hypothetical protein ICV64_09375 [Thermoleophilia bacterium]|nr:hypothetical protein [Thermoleophilia bacterium]
MTVDPTTGLGLPAVRGKRNRIASSPALYGRAAPGLEALRWQDVTSRRG